MIESMTQARQILDRAERVRASHQAAKQTYDSVRAAPAPDGAAPPSPFRTFPDHPRVALPTTLLDAPEDALRVLADGLDALPESHVTPPQDLKTLASWLHLADGLTGKSPQGPGDGSAPTWLRTCPSSGALFPVEIYVAAFAMRDLPAGLYHYSPREFCLRKLREGGPTLARITRGRPDLAFVKTCPAALLVSTIFWRPAWKFGARGYRYALLDAGHLVQNLATCAQGLGIQTMARLRVNDAPLRELIGVPPDAPFGEAEAVQAMVVWADKATLDAKRPKPAPPADPHAAPHFTQHPVPHPAPPGAAPAEAFAAGPARPAWRDGPPPAGPAPAPGPLASSAFSASPARTASTNMARERTMQWEATPEFSVVAAPVLPPIARLPLSPRAVSYGSILATHQDCVAGGVALREIRPPLTELSPLPPLFPSQRFARRTEPEPGLSLRQTLRTRRSPRDFRRESIPLDSLLTLNRLAFAGGTFLPLFPAGAHVALVRPLWIVHAVSGLSAGLWYCHPPTGAWSLLQAGAFRREARYLSLEQDLCGNASAVCFLVANLQALMAQAGPDAYRLAHLEAGVAAQRLCLAATAMGLASAALGAFYDDEVRKFFGLGQTGWEAVYEVAVGVPAEDAPSDAAALKIAPEDSDWRD